VVVSAAVAGLEPATYASHPIHGSDRVWTETNCAIDVWVEVLHALGRDPVAGLGFVFGSDFDGSQWTFLKYPLDELRALYGVDVAELNIWRPVADHIAEQLAAGRLITVEVDAWFLPDTHGVSYRTSHDKTTIVPGMIDPAGRRLHYFHNTGYHELSGEDYDGVFAAAEAALPPYVELVRVDRLGERSVVDEGLVDRLVAGHLSDRPADDPAGRLAEHLLDRLEWLPEAGPEAFHKVAFGTLRQFGAAAELGADLAERLLRRDGADTEPVERLRRAAQSARTAQLVLARAARGRRSEPAEPLKAMADDWDSALGALAGRYA
jgi:hypothetical protein